MCTEHVANVLLLNSDMCGSGRGRFKYDGSSSAPENGYHVLCKIKPTLKRLTKNRVMCKRVGKYLW